MKFYIILFIILPLKSISQNNFPALIKGSWVKTRCEMKDGSSNVARDEFIDDFLEYTFNEDNDGVFRSSPIDQIGFKYFIKDSVLSISEKDYRIEFLYKEKLIFTEINANLTNDKLKRFFLTKSDTYLEFYSSSLTLDKHYPIQDSIYASSIFLFPVYQGSIHNDKPAIKFVGDLFIQFVVTKLNTIEKFEVVNNQSNISPKDLSILKRFIESTGVKWALPNSYNKKSISISLKLNGFKINQVNVVAIHHNLKYNIRYPLLPQDLQKKADIAFQKGIKSMRNKKFDEALKFFNQCTEIDNLYIDAYYNKIFLNNQLGQKELVCNDLSYLVKLGQKLAIEYYKQFCK